jgi:hypothetical protein
MNVGFAPNLFVRLNLDSLAGQPQTSLFAEGRRDSTAHKVKSSEPWPRFPLCSLEYFCRRVIKNLELEFGQTRMATAPPTTSEKISASAAASAVLFSLHLQMSALAASRPCDFLEGHRPLGDLAVEVVTNYPKKFEAVVAKGSILLNPWVGFSIMALSKGKDI